MSTFAAQPTGNTWGFTLRKLVDTRREYPLALDHFVLELVFFAHGAQKLRSLSREIPISNYQ